MSDRSIEVVGHDDWFLSGKTFDPHNVANRFREKLNEALARGYAGMRVNGSPAWLHDAGPKELHKFEAELDKLFPNERTIASCTYPLATIGADEIFDVVRTHQFAIARRQGEWEVIETLELIQAKQEIRRLNEALEQRVIERTNDLRVANEELRKEIAERKEAEDALRRSEDRLRLVIDTVPALIHTGLPDGQLDFFNQRWLDFVGLSLEDLSGWKWTAAIHPEDVAAMVERWRATLATGEPYEHAARVRRADGEYRWMVHREVPLRDERGNIVKWYASSIDIEDRKRAEDALRQSEDHLRLVIDTIPTMAWSVRPGGVVDFVNQRWIDYTGLSLEEEIEEPTRPIHPEDIPRVMERWKVEREVGEPYEEEMRLRRADGEYRWFLVRTAPLCDEQGNLVKWYGVSIDIEDRKRAEEKLMATSEQLRSLSARLGSAREEEGVRIARELHDDLGAALSSLRWDLEDVDESMAESASGSELLELRQKLAAMMKLTDTSINTIRRIGSELRPIALDALGLVEAIELHARQFQDRTGINVEFECSMENVDLNREQSTAVFRIFQEALTNILRHAQATRVDIHVSEEQGEFILMVSDNGRGITDDEKSAKYTLGLLGMRERAHLIGGTIDITGSVGKGTSVTVRIPIPILA